jgi:branched-chain amino acid transport system substrate-binding protein
MIRSKIVTRGWVLALSVAATFGCAAITYAQQPGRISDGVVKIGLLLDMAGIYSDITGAGAVTAAKMAIDDFGGKVRGRPIELIVADHQNKAPLAAELASQWFDRRQVDAILDVVATPPSLAVMEVARRKNKIVVLTSPATVTITNEACGPNFVHWTYDTYAMAHGTGEAMVKQGYDTWFFLTADYVFGHVLEQNVRDVVIANGGKVLGSVRAPLNTADFSSFLLQAQASKAKVVGLANAGADTINSIKQAAEFGIVRGGQKIAGLLVFLNDVHSLGLETAQGMLLTAAFYWDMNDETRNWSQRFFKLDGRMPNMVQAGQYSSMMHYLKAVEAAGTDETTAVMQKMRSTPINDFFFKNGRIREDGRMVHDMYLFEVKKPFESKGPWDYYKLVTTIPGDKAFLPLSESKCSLVKK